MAKLERPQAVSTTQVDEGAREKAIEELIRRQTRPANWSGVWPPQNAADVERARECFRSLWAEGRDPHKWEKWP